MSVEIKQGGEQGVAGRIDTARAEVASLRSQERLARVIAAAFTPEEVARLRALSLDELTARIGAAIHQLSGRTIEGISLDDDTR